MSPLERHSRMSRGAKPLRSAPLRGESTLARTREPKRGDAPKCTTSLPTKRKPAGKAEKRARRLVSARAGGICEVQHLGCLLMATDYQHIKRRPHCTKRELWCPSNAVAICRPCHVWIGTAKGRPVAAQHGWHMESWQTPGAVPVLINSRWWLLDNDGGRTPYIPKGHAA